MYNEDIRTIALLMSDLDLDQSGVAKAVKEETGHGINQGTISRVLAGQAKDATITLVRYALENIQSKGGMPNKTDEHYKGSVTQQEQDSEVVTWFVTAESEEEAINRVASYGVNVHGAKNHYDYDCTGQWFADPARAEFVKFMQCYAVTMRWLRDV
ncbi:MULTISPECIES: hypothetical protein [unclassified Vibrio]|uniref:hypothetical protein n=1 Tax=unclassified Vibrio TaxID=2614977 RepID=UPI001269392C|nr:MULTISPECIES: hypothetical protein [unclassified Vibrio]QFT40081.1 hypothetical protein FIU99_27195 [Vibrio sp. THAF64]QGM38026.1 hypothetical protein GGC04_27400 [Vibrio sp. THAF191d]QGN73515.1 hypothetical protein GGC03_27380 [Vibrio sp. THAF191c]